MPASDAEAKRPTLTGTGAGGTAAAGAGAGAFAALVGATADEVGADRGSVAGVALPPLQAARVSASASQEYRGRKCIPLISARGLRKCSVGRQEGQGAV